MKTLIPIAAVAILLLGAFVGWWLFSPLFEDVEAVGGSVSFEQVGPESLSGLNRNASVRLGLLKPYDLTFYYPSNVTDDEFEKLDLSRFETLVLDCPKLTQRSAAAIASFDNIRRLRLPMKSVNDDWIIEIGKLKDLTMLNVDGTTITNRSVDLLRSMQKLEVLSVENTSLNSEDVVKLLDAPLLEDLYITDDQFSEELRNRCKSHIPEVRLHIKVKVTNRISMSELEELFAGIRKDGKWNIEGDMFWGYYFTDADRATLEKAAKQLEAAGYRYVDIFRAENDGKPLPYYFLHVEKFETHSVKSLHERNTQLAAFANENDLDNYDGMDVGPVKTTTDAGKPVSPPAATGK